MRDFLEDADQHREDGYGRAQAHVRRQLPKRFYKSAAVEPVDGGFAVTLDGRPTKTPGGKKIVVPAAPLATAMAAEWNGQGEEIDPLTMPLVRLVNSALEVGPERQQGLRDEVISYAGSDLLLYRADTPRELVAEQERLWDDALVRLARHFGIAFQPTVGIVHQPQPDITLAKLSETLQEEGLLALAAMVVITGITGSGLLAIALRQRLLTADEVWAAAHVDEDHNIRLWGEVEEAAARREKRRRDFDAAVQMLDLQQE
ncbi:MAG TPA: ATP12 family protein [Devosiaceae bacterium]|jgi:chaperone required for assembly of F1-ATPase|nr:ATP12 family protein [Devosiaceae bacterium]